MQNILNDYAHIILDFSAMFAELDSNLVQALNEADNVLVAPTFDCECKQMQEVVPYRIATRYKENKDNITIDAKMVCNSFGTVDTFGLANCLSHNAGSVLVIEANFSLEDRIILSGLGVDVYSWFEDGLIRHEDYTTEAASRTIDKTKTPLKYYEVKSGDSVYTDTGTYVLAESLEQGAEAQIYRISNDPKILAKVYKLDEDGNFVLTSQKLKNIDILKEVNDSWDVLWLALPTAIIYADSSHKSPVGYMMKYFDQTKFLSNNSLFNGGDINAKFPEHDEATVKDVLDICIKLVRQILFLALNNIHISDYNDKNFTIPIKSDSKILMVDTDSYCYEGYVSEYITYSGCLSKKYECNNRLDLINLCYESLLAFIFTHLVLDSGFVPMRKSEFRFSANQLSKLKNPNIKAKWKSIPANLQNLFINVFDKKYPPSINVLLYELEVAYRQDFANTKYKDIYKEVLEFETAKTVQQPITLPNIPQSQPIMPPPPRPLTSPTRPNPPSGTGSSIWPFVLIVIGIVLVVLVLAGLGVL